MDFIDKEKQYWDNRVKKRTNYNAKYNKIENMWYEKYIGKITNKKILDVGCGVDDLFIPYWIESKNKVTTIDLSQKTINIYKRILKKLNLKADLICCTLEDIKFKEQFDVIHVKWMLHHTQDIPLSLRKIYNSLKKGGIAIITESNRLYPARVIVQFPHFRKINFLRYLALKTAYLDPNELARTPQYYSKEIKKAGFKIEEIDYKTDYELLSYPTRIYIKNNKVINFFKRVDRLLLKIPFVKYFGMDVKFIAVK